MDDLLNDFLTETGENLTELDVALVRLERTSDDAGTLSLIFRLVHTVKGTCGFLGLPRLEAVAHHSENIMGRYRDGSLKVAVQDVSLILEAFDRIKEIVAGNAFHRPTGGYIGVVNVGLDDNWLGNHLALANLYGFGRLAWDPNLTSKAIVEEWTQLTFGDNPAVAQAISQIQLASWKVYESYTGVLGLQTLTNILGSHYGPAPQVQEEQQQPTDRERQQTAARV